jgi:RNA polymerase sigma-70 factor (ECF subfamily)
MRVISKKRMNTLSDLKLVEAVLSGDRESYGCLFERHERSVQAVALAVLGDYHAAQDVVQDSFVIAYTKLGGLRKGSSFGPWVRKIARRQAIQISQRLLKQQKAKPHVTHVNPATGDGQIDELNRRLLDAVIRLPKHERVVIMLRYFDNHSTKMISQITGRPVGTITMQLSRAHARLHKWLKEKSK